jgi:UDP-N-acetylmuramyl pentapeptide phosphotransferase/UDP-N-acetylglucosamine-1-phosphate transferase
MPILIVVMVIAVATYLLGFPVAKTLARMGAIDKPNPRSSHSIPVVRGGGIAIMLVVLSGGLAVGWRSGVVPVLMGLAFGLAVLSFWDDLRPLRPAIRFGGHALAAIGVLYALNWPRFSLDLASQLGVAWPALVSGLFLFLWLAGYANAFNFMDGINGLAAGQAIVSGLGMALLGSVVSGQPPAPRAYGPEGWSASGPEGLWPGEVVSPPVLLSLVIAGACAGFLPHNFPRARMFMGDVGSAPLGFLLAALVVWIARDYGWWLLIPLGLLHANFVLDTGLTLARRVLRGERWYEAHREHFYQRLIRSGKSHVFVTGWELALQVLVLGLMVLYLYASAPVRAGLIALVILMWLAFFAYCERLFRRSCLKQKLAQ